MHRKDYELVARVLAAGLTDEDYGGSLYLDDLVELFGIALKEDNPAFDLVRFATAAGFQGVICEEGHATWLHHEDEKWDLPTCTRQMFGDSPGARVCGETVVFVNDIGRRS